MRKVSLPWAPQRWMSPAPSRPPATATAAREMPDLAEDDREGLFLEDLVSLTVALDVISTYTKKLSDDGTVLASLCEKLRDFAALGQPEDDTEALFALAKSPAGRARAHLSDRLTRTVTRLHPEALEKLPLTTPRSVGGAARRLEAAAVLLIREAILRLATKDALDQRQL